MNPIDGSPVLREPNGHERSDYPKTSYYKSRRLHSPSHTPPRIGLGGVLRCP